MTDFTHIAQKFTDSLTAVLPCKQDKSPLLPTNWKGGFPVSNFIDVPAVGLICGVISGGIEVLDCDNHQRDAADNLKALSEIPEVKKIFDTYRLPIESTQGGGYHIIWRALNIEGNQKLAQRLNDKNRPDAFFETKGEGGYIVCYPSNGYQLIKNDIFNIADIFKWILSSSVARPFFRQFLSTLSLSK